MNRWWWLGINVFLFISALSWHWELSKEKARLNVIKTSSYEAGVEEGRTFGTCVTWDYAVLSQRYPLKFQADIDRCTDELIAAEQAHGDR